VVFEAFHLDGRAVFDGHPGAATVIAECAIGQNLMWRRHEMFLSGGWLRVGAMVKQAVQTAESVHQGFSRLSLPSSKEVPECVFCRDQPTFLL
jgi:hypothetical protein